MDRFVISRELRVACNKEILRFRNKVAELLDRTKWSYLGPNQNTDMLTTLHITRSIYRPAIRLNLNLKLPHWFHEIIFLIHGIIKSRYNVRRKSVPVLVFSTWFSVKMLTIIRENVPWMKFNYRLKYIISYKISVRFLIDIIKLYPFIII